MTADGPGGAGAGLDRAGLDTARGRHPTVAANSDAEVPDLFFERVDDFLEGAHAPDDQTLMLLRRMPA